MSNRITSINLYKGVPLNQGAPHTLTFNSRQEQTNYFNTKRVNIQSNLSYQRLSNNSFKIGIGINSIRNCNYCSIINSEALPSADTRIYYAFIDNMEYISDNATVVYYTIDFYQTYLFELIAGVQPCYVSREHVNNDSKFANTVKEPFNLGEVTERSLYRFNGSASSLFALRGYVIITAAGYEKIKDDSITRGLEQIHLGNSRPFTEVCLKGTVFDINRLLFDIVHLDYTGLTSDDIYAAWVGVEIGEGGWTTEGDKSSITLFLDTPASLNEYKPVNNKLFNSQFNMYTISTPANTINVFPESIKTSQISTTISTNFNGFGLINYQFSLYDTILSQTLPDIEYNYTYQCYTTGLWSKNILSEYLAYNTSRINHNLSYARDKYLLTANYIDYTKGSAMARNILNTASSLGNNIVSGIESYSKANPFGIAHGVIGGASSLGTGIINQTDIINKAQYESDVNRLNFNKVIDGEAALQADYSGMPNIQKGGIQNADFALSNLRYLEPLLSQYTYSENVLKAIDTYFSRYGYQVNTVKKPNITGRSKFNYVQTQGSLVRGDIPALPCITFQQQLDSGITFWHIGSDLDDSFVGNYTVANPIV